MIALERASALLDLGRPQEALEHLRRAAAEAPDDPEVHYLTALTALKRGRDAREAALVAARIAPEQATVHTVLARALQASGDRWGAEDAARHATGALQTALALDPEDAENLNNLAVARLRACGPYGIGDAFEAAAKLDPRLEVARHNLLHTGPAGLTFVYRRSIVAAGLLALLCVPWSPAFAVFLLLAAAGFEAARRSELRRLSPATRALLDDDRRTRRFKPLRWDWRWITRLRPWWWRAFR